MSSSPETTSANLKKLWPLIRPHLRALLIVSAMVVLVSAIGLVTPSVAGRVVDNALKGNADTLRRVILFLIALFAGLGILTFFKGSMLSITGSRFLLRLRHHLFSHLVRLTPAFYESRRLGELLSRMGSDLTVVQHTITGQIPRAFQAVLSFVGTLIVLLLMHTKLTLVSMAIIPPVILVAVWYGGRLQKLATKVQDALADTQSVTEEALSGIRTVQAFNSEQRELDRYEEKLTDLLQEETRQARLGSAFDGILQFTAYSSFAIVLWYGGYLIQQKQLSPGDLTAFLLYVFRIAGSVGTLGSLYTSYRELKGASARVFELLETEPDVQDPPEPTVITEPKGRLVFDNVSFRYPSSAEDRWAIQNLNLTIEPGEMVALVGPSGSGKTTIFSLLLRFYDPISGQILLDGHPLPKMTLADLRQTIGLVPQEIFLFSETVEENVRYGRPNAERVDLENATRSSGAISFIEDLPQQWEEMVGEKGVKLSVGQRQRIAIARAFLRNPTILLLDEATSALDAESEEIVQQALAQLSQNRTTLVIAHRLATAQRADRIVVLEKGQIVGCGPHEELRESNELYRRYWELQTLTEARGSMD